MCCFFFQAEDGIRDVAVTGVQTCALPISFPSFHDIKQVSMAGGVQPRWRGDGKELFFIDPQGKMMSATVERGAAPKIGIPRKLFDTGLVPDPTVNQYAVTEDGLKFLVLEPRKGFLETYSVVLNWRATVN